MSLNLYIRIEKYIPVDVRLFNYVSGLVGNFYGVISKITDPIWYYYVKENKYLTNNFIRISQNCNVYLQWIALGLIKIMTYVRTLKNNFICAWLLIISLFQVTNVNI